MLQWMFFEQYVHEPSIAVARFIRAFLKRHDDERLPDLLKRGNRALGIMEQHLANRSWFAGERLSLADLSLYAYTHKADDGGFDSECLSGGARMAGALPDRAWHHGDAFALKEQSWHVG